MEKSCGVIVYRFISDKPEFLVGFQRKSRTWSFPKGHVESGESEIETASRELREELGIWCDLNESQRFELTYMTIAGYLKEVVLFLPRFGLGFDVSSEVLINSEIEELKWVNKNESISLLRHPQYKEILSLCEEYIIRQYID